MPPLSATRAAVLGAMRIRTDRVDLRPLTTGDAEALHLLWTRPRVRRFLWDGAVVPAEQTLEIVSRSMVALRDNEYGLWGARAEGDERLVGVCGFWPFFDPPRAQLLYVVSPDLWGAGLATEMARAMLRFGFEEHGFAVIEAAIDAPNQASIRVARRVGLRRTGRGTPGGRETEFYELVRHEFDPTGVSYELEGEAGRPGPRQGSGKAIPA